MNAYISSKSELNEVVTLAVERTVRNLIPELIRKATDKKYLTKEEVKDLTGWSDRTLQHLRDSRQIPFVKHGKKILYPYEGFMQFLEECKIKTIK
jgi:excisionase family DNA binding protein